MHLGRQAIIIRRRHHEPKRGRSGPRTPRISNNLTALRVGRILAIAARKPIAYRSFCADRARCSCRCSRAARVPTTKENDPATTAAIAAASSGAHGMKPVIAAKTVTTDSARVTGPSTHATQSRCVRMPQLYSASVLVAARSAGAAAGKQLLQLGPLAPRSPNPDGVEEAPQSHGPSVRLGNRSAIGRRSSTRPTP